MNRTVYATLIAMRDEAWDARSRAVFDVDREGEPDTGAAWFWYHQGRAEAYAQAMTLLEAQP